MSEQTAKHGVGQDEYLDTRGRQAAARVAEDHQVEPAAVDDEPDRLRGIPGATPSEGMSREEIELRSQLAAALGRHAFPGDRERLLDVATEQGADDRVLGLLRRLPAGERFENVQAAVRALGLAVEPPEAPR